MVASEHDKMLAYMLMAGGNSSFWPLLNDLEKDFLLHKNHFPITVDVAMVAMELYMQQPMYKAGMAKKGHAQNIGKQPLLSFAQKAARMMMEKRMCFQCGEVGHIAKDCPKAEEAVSHFAFGTGWSD